MAQLDAFPLCGEQWNPDSIRHCYGCIQRWLLAQKESPILTFGHELNLMSKSLGGAVLLMLGGAGTHTIPDGITTSLVAQVPKGLMVTVSVGIT